MNVGKDYRHSGLAVRLADILVLIIADHIANIIVFRKWSYNFVNMGEPDLKWVMVMGYLVSTVFFTGTKNYISYGIYKEIYNTLKVHFNIVVFTLCYMYLKKISSDYSRFHFIIYVCFDIILMITVHRIMRHMIIKKFRDTTYCERVLFITDSERALPTIQKMKKTKNWDFRVDGVALIDTDEVGGEICGIPVVGSRENFLDVLQHGIYDSVLIKIKESDKCNFEENISHMIDMGVTVHINIDDFDISVPVGVRFDKMGLLGVVTFKLYEYNFAQVFIKRVMDIVGSILGMFFLGIAMLIFAPLIKLESKGPVLFRQIRIGKGGRRFYIYKFRSMINGAEEKKAELINQNQMDGQIFKLKDDPRITKVGRFMRKFSIDELPQFINVFRGQMSLVGTRPPTEDEFLEYETIHRRRVSIKPGMTGLWQVSGRSSVTDFNDIVRLDCEYIDNWSVGQDIKILFKTVWVVLFGKGAQ
ncbi:MAG: sugar transferase [Lachnospiraceae bacterium]|nr:sugar transferase [Lachnospiraceae bacterium]